MLIKKKSLVVALVSSIVIALVLILTLAGYFLYLEFRGEEFKRRYQELFGAAKAKVYSKYIDVEKLDAKIENTGALKGKPVIEGVVTNKSGKDVFNLVLKISFIDRDNAVIYETDLHPQEPALGGVALGHVNIPHLYSPPRTVLKPNEPAVFKKIMSNCPTEIFLELREGEKPKKAFGRWSGKLTARPVYLEF